MVQKVKPAAGMHLKVISPDRLLYEGMIDSLVVKTEDGYEGFLRGRAPCCKLLAAQGDDTVRCDPARGRRRRARRCARRRGWLPAGAYPRRVPLYER